MALIALSNWKKVSSKEWANKNISAKHKLIETLLYSLSMVFEKEVNVAIRPGPTCSYDPKTKTIYLDNSGSIISALHEMGHHLYGSSELKACVFSVNLFKEVYAMAYSRLHWKGHMLVK